MSPASFKMNSISLSGLLVLLLSVVSQFPAACLAQEDTAMTTARKVETSTTASQSSSTSSAPPQTHTIQVGLADHKFRPEVLKAAVGDTVEFRFYPANHSVVRAEYGIPCIPYEMTGADKFGFFSGFNAVDKVVDDPPKYSIKINDTSPMFFYCSAPGSCITYGMVGAINPNASTPIATQQQLAKDSAYMLNPGEPFPAESPLPSNLPGITPVPTISSTGKKHSLSPGAIAGIVIAALSVIVLASLLFFFWGRTATLKNEVERKESSIARRISSTPNMLQTPHLSSPSGPTSSSIFPHQQHHSQPASPEQTHGTQPSTYFSSQSQKYTSPVMASHPAFSFATSPSPHETHTSPTYELPQQGHSYFSAHPALRPSSSHYVPPPANGFAQEAKLGPYGMQATGMGAGAVRDEGAGGGPAPPYGWHVNAVRGPAEMEGTPVGSEGGGTEEKEREVVREREVWRERGARWEEVETGDRRMF